MPLLLLVIGLGVKVLIYYYQPESYTSKTAEILICSAIWVGVLGLLIRIFTVGYTPVNTSGRNTNQGQVADQLNTTGIYSLIRNPLYLGNYLMWLAIGMLTGNIWFVLVFSFVFWIYYERIVFAEEEFLRNKFGEVYIEWTTKTPPFLPLHFRYQKPTFSFSWKKVLKKEKNGLLALFVLFYLFDVLDQYLRTETIAFEWNWMTIGSVATGALYVILKIIKKSTNLLNEEGR